MFSFRFAQGLDVRLRRSITCRNGGGLVMRIRLGALIVALTAWGGAAGAETVTPSNCHWVALPETPTTIEMWCRGPDGRARATGRTMQQDPASTSDGCPAGKLYDGRRCVSEAEALAAAPQAPYAAPIRPSTPTPQAAPAPRVLMFQDRDGRNRRGMACVAQHDVTICQPIRRR
jgi:hypothetical protein